MSTNFILTDEQSPNSGDQLSFDFQSVAEINEKNINAVKLAIPDTDPQNVTIPHLNTPDNFIHNFVAVSGNFENDTVEAARYILRAMSKPDRDFVFEKRRNVPENLGV
jgi:hypothetical protein